MIDEGYIKYHQEFINDNSAVTEEMIQEINDYRTRLYKMKLIGAYDEIIGYGNISYKMANGKILISGTQTGQTETLGSKHYTIIENYDIDANTLTCRGPIKASSEALTHAAIYELSSEIAAVIHIHSKVHWDKYLNVMPTTKAEVSYGTPDMAYEVKRLYDEGPMKENPVMIMAGHDEGIITFGKDFKEAMKVLEELL
ncbi:MAG: class II aldolase/adducin family protein [Bacteroidia bacterium]